MRGHTHAPTVDRVNSKEAAVTTRAAEHFDTVIVGGGQAGLSVGYYLTRRGHDCVILDANERVGDSWRQRWPSLRLYSPARYDGLPGMPFPAPRHTFPSGYDMADYLEAYAKRFELPGPKRSSAWTVSPRTARGTCSRQVIAASRPTTWSWRPGVIRNLVIPAVRGRPRSVGSRSSTPASIEAPRSCRTDRSSSSGASHSGGDIAFEVARTHPDVAVGSGYRAGPLPASRAG